MPDKIFVNLPVADLDRAMGFFRKLGFAFNERFTDATAACMVVSDSIYVMLLTTEKFAGFTPKPVCDAHSATEVLVCLSCASREEVDRLVRDAVAAVRRGLRLAPHGAHEGAQLVRVGRLGAEPLHARARRGPQLQAVEELRREVQRLRAELNELRQKK